jgi:hypothetical protein
VTSRENLLLGIAGLGADLGRQLGWQKSVPGLDFTNFLKYRGR